MALIYVTGVSGAGKSTVCEELRKRGYAAYGMDEERLTEWHDRIDRRPIGWPERQVVKTNEFLEGHLWLISRDRLEEIAKQTENETAFICGNAANESEVWDLFSQVIYLSIDEQTVRDRLASRTTNEFGQEPHELSAALGWLQTAERRHISYGAAIVDGKQSLERVVEAILKKVRAIDVSS